MSNRKDIQLVIKARTEGERAVQSLAAALGEMFDAASGGDAQSNIARLGTSLVGLDKTLTAVRGQTDQVASAYDRLGDAVTATLTQLAGKQSELEGMRRGLASLKAQVDTTFVGPQRPGLSAVIKGVEKDVRSAEAQVGKLTATLARQQTELAQFPSSLQRLASTERGLGEAAQFGQAAIEAQTKALEQQATAAHSLSSIQQKINSVTGVNRADTTGSAERSAAVLREVAARDELVQKFQQEARAAASLAQVEQLLIRPAGAATAGGASTEALEERAAAEQKLIEATRANATFEEQRAQAAQRLVERTQPLVAIQNRLNAALKEARALHAAGAISAEQLAKAQDHLQHEAQEAAAALERVGKGERGQVSLFGLKPYALTNLSFQINDVVTGLISGQRPLQIIAQQGGQILQLFPKAGAAIVAALANPAVLAAGVTMGALAAGIGRATEEAERLRVLEATLVRIGDHAGVSARELSTIVDGLDRIGLSGDDALKVVSGLVGELDPSRIQQFGVMTRNLAEVLGIDVTEASRKLRDGLTANFEAIQRLNEEIQILRPDELEHIRLMHEAGRAGEARAEAVELLNDRLEKTHETMDGPWKRAARGAEAVLGGFTKKLGESITEMAKSPTVLGDIVRGITLAADALGDFADQQERLGQNGKPTGDPRNPNGRAAQEAEIARQREIATQMDLIELEEAYQEAIESGQRANATGQRVALAYEKAYREELAKNNDAIKARTAAVIAEARERAKIRAEDRRDRNQGVLSTARTFIGRDENIPADRSVLKSFFKAANIDVDPQMVAWCAAFVNAVLAANGLKGSGSLSARSFLNVGEKTDTPQAGDIVVLKRGTGGAQGHVGFLSGFDGAGNPRVVGGNQSGGRAVSEQTFNRKDVLGFRRLPTDPAKLLDFDLKRVDAQADFNTKLDEAALARTRETEEVKRQLGLSGQALREAEREATVREAVFQAEQEAQRRGLTLDDDHRRKIEETTRALFDQQRAREAVTQDVDLVSGERQALLERLDVAREAADTALMAGLEAELRKIDEALRQAIDRAIDFWKPYAADSPEARAAVTGLESLRTSIGRTSEEIAAADIETPLAHLQAQSEGLRQLREQFREEGMTAAADDLTERLKDVDAQLLKSIDDAIAFWSTSSRPEAAAMLLQYQALRQELIASQQEFRITAGEIQQAFAGDFVNAFESFAQSVAEGKNVFKSFGRGVLQFAADFLRSLSSMILKVIALRLAMKLIGGGSGFGIFHGGGWVGAPGRSRIVSPAVFAGAARYHQGGIAGLRPGEVPAILERGERVLSKSEVRNQAMAGLRSGGGGEARSIRVVGVFDPKEIPAAMAAPPGEQVLMAFIRRNRVTIRQELDV